MLMYSGGTLAGGVPALPARNWDDLQPCGFLIRLKLQSQATHRTTIRRTRAGRTMMARNFFTLRKQNDPIDIFQRLAEQDRPGVRKFSSERLGKKCQGHAEPGLFTAGPGDPRGIRRAGA